MARHKEDLLDRLLSNLSLRGAALHPTTLFIVATAIIIGGAIFLWERHQDKIVNLDEFRLTEEKIRLTPPPVWAETDLKQLVIEESQNTTPSILDTQLVPRTANVFRKVGFIERVRSIEKSKTGLDIDIVYREPVALVELSAVTLPKEWPAENRGKQVLLPVDRYGVLMPESLGNGLQLPLITIPYPAQFTSLTTWADWPDERIKDSAAISGILDSQFSEIGVARIVTRRIEAMDADASDQPPYELWSGSGTRIVWGNAPGKESQGEVNPSEKIQVIKAVVSKYGSLNKTNLGRIDVRGGRAIVVDDTKTAANKGINFTDLK